MNFKVTSQVILFVTMSMLWTAMVHAGESNVFSKRRDLPLLESASPDAKPAAKAAWNEELQVLSSEGRWLKVSSKDGEGWVYAGNVSKSKLPEENKNDIPIKAGGMTASAAGRSLSEKALQYANSHNLGDVSAQVQWAEKFSANISRDDAMAYLKSHKLGEFTEKK